MSQVNLGDRGFGTNSPEQQPDETELVPWRRGLGRLWGRRGRPVEQGRRPSTPVPVAGEVGQTEQIMEACDLGPQLVEL
ncbi:MAG: hypothetical protein OEY41_16695, partial [Acidimicrobiia bacterium]|nr:hypothetical protein [Acidimicrobiia bacterium]